VENQFDCRWSPIGTRHIVRKELKYCWALMSFGSLQRISIRVSVVGVTVSALAGGLP
jgi:hypothetical protein